MFRKPKKKPSALRGVVSSSISAGAGVGGGDYALRDASAAAGGTRKRRRPAARRRRDSSSSSEGDGGEGNGGEEEEEEEEDTSALLRQIQRERDENKGSAKKSKSGGVGGAAALLLNASSTAYGAASRKKKGKGKGMGGDDDGNGNGNGNNKNWMHQYKSGEGQLTVREMATRTAEYHPAESASATIKKSSSSGVVDGEKDGEEGAADSERNARLAALQSKPARNKFLAGPLRATTFVRTTARFDYQPDVCKDYKETGFCGFGDTCIYLHDRGDTKTGWQMEREYEEKKKKEEERKGREMERFMNSMMCGEVAATTSSGAGGGEGEGAKNGKGDDDGIPFACHICRGPFVDPIVTPCSHYFCQNCMLARIREGGNNMGCPVCQKDTNGVLNHAQRLVAKKRRLVGRDGTWEEYLERSRGGGGGGGSVEGDDAA